MPFLANFKLKAIKTKHDKSKKNFTRKHEITLIKWGKNDK